MQGDAVGGLTQVSKDKMEELDRAQRMLSSAIRLALAVSEARLKAEAAFIVVRRMLRNSGPGVSVGELQDLAGTLEEVAPPDPGPGEGSDFSDRLQYSLENLQRTQIGAKAEAQTIVQQMIAPGAAQFAEQGRVFALSQAITGLRIAVAECAGACAGESQDHVKLIEYRVRSILDQFGGEHEPSSKPAGEKGPAVEGGALSPKPSVLADRKLGAAGDRTELKHQNERSGDPWTGTH